MTDPNLLTFLITTFDSVVCLDFDLSRWAELSPRIIHKGNGVYFGITYERQYIYVLCRNYNNSRKSGHTILVFDKSLSLLSEISLGNSVSEGHQMVLFNGNFYVANTNRNCISFFSRSGELQSDFYPIPENKNHNYNHLNSIFIDGRSMTLCLANRMRNSFFLKFGLPPLNPLSIDALGLAAHNYLRFNGRGVICDSYNGALMGFRSGFDPSGKEWELERVNLMPDTQECIYTKISMNKLFLRHYAGASCYARGLSGHDNILAVGLSEFGKRSSRANALSRIMIIENPFIDVPSSPSRVKTIELGQLGAVMDVRLISHPDLGHPIVSA